MRRYRQRSHDLVDDEVGQDSFLDTIANFVGVMAILVVVVGAQSRNLSADQPIPVDHSAEIAELSAAIDGQVAFESSVRSDNRELEQKIAVESRMADLRDDERQQMLVLLTEMEQHVAERYDQMAHQQKTALQSADHLQTLYRQLNEIEQAISATQSASRVETIEHYPTPIAKTVFRDEVHFRLSQGQIVYVPLDELIELMRNEWRVKAEQLQAAPQITESVGPIAQFRLQYELSRRTVKQQTPVGPVERETVEFDRFTIFPAAAQLGESVEAAIQPGSQFHDRIDRLRPDRHTISVWVYPDSFAEFNRLKSWLFARGFQTATWPLSADSHISGGPNGYRTTAQ